MIGFFRRIRRNLANQNKFVQYSRYAIGEIFLVVIGILIALWLNNLNVKEQQRIEEVAILKELKKDFRKDIIDFQENIAVYKKISSSVDIILKTLESSNVYHDSLDSYFAQTTAYPLAIINKSAFEVLKSKGLDLISNDSLRKEILYFHGEVYISIKTWENQYNRDMYFEEIIKRFDKVEPWRFDETGKIFDGKMKPNNYKALKTDALYMSILKSMKRGAETLLYFRYFKIIENLEILIAHIDKELDHLD